MGDVKLYAAIALALGWWGVQPALLALLLAFGLATIVVIWLLATGKAKIGSSIALGPYLLCGFIGAATLVITGQG
jgi:leader peptidase (prepilin peptidase)/N-methyltransferase